MTKLRRSFLIYLAVGVVLAFAAWQFIDTSPARTQLPLDRYEARLSEGKVASATLLDKDHEVHGTLTDGTNYTVKFPDGYTEQLTKNIVASKAKFDVDSQKDSPWLTLLLGWLPFILLIGIVLFVLSRVQGGGRLMGFGKSRAKVLNKDEPQTTFADVAGLDEAVEELQEIKEFLEAPAKFQDIGAKIPKGALLFGPPGTGKTLLHNLEEATGARTEGVIRPSGGPPGRCGAAPRRRARSRRRSQVGFGSRRT